MEWISVNEKVPENRDDVLIYTSKGFYVGWYDEIGGWFSGPITACKTVTYWMPLPDKPKEAKMKTANGVEKPLAEWTLKEVKEFCNRNACCGCAVNCPFRLVCTVDIPCNWGLQDA